MLETRNLDVFYGKSHAVQGVSMHVDAGEVVALLGRNGAGKTTTCAGMMGLLPGARGDVVVNGHPVGTAMPHKRARAGLGYVPQGRLLFDGLSVEDNLRAVSHGDTEIWDQALTLFPRVGERLHQTAGTLSGGEQQMVAIARAMLTRPRVMILDEPTTGLQPSIVEQLRKAVHTWRAQGMGVLLVEEQIPFALDVADRVYLMDIGRIAHDGPPSDLEDGALLHRYLGVGA